MTNEELVKQIQQGVNTKEYLGQLYVQNKPIITSIVKRYVSERTELDDLLQESYMGLLNAVQGYNASIGCKFITYAENWIKQSARAYVYNKSHIIRRPIHFEELLFKYKRFAAEYNRDYGKYPDRHDIMTALDISDTQLDNLLRYKNQPSSLNVLIDEYEESELADVIPDEKIHVEYDVLQKIYNEELLTDLDFCIRKYLNENQQRVIKGIYFDNRTLSALSNDLNVSPGRIRQIREESLSKLKRLGRKRLNRYIELQSKVYRSSYSSFIEHNTSIVEYIAMESATISEADKACSLLFEKIQQADEEIAERRRMRLEAVKLSRSPTTSISNSETKKARA